MEKSSLVKNFYEEMAKEGYHPLDNIEGLINRRGLRKLVSFDDRFLEVKKLLEAEIKKQIKSKKTIKVLDIACGDGVYEQILDPNLRKNLEIDGTDLSEVQKEKGHHIFNTFYLVDLDKENIPVESSTYDIVIISEILEHLFFPENPLREAFRVLKPGGKLIFTAPNSANLRTLVSLILFQENVPTFYPGQKQHIRFFNLKGLKNLVKDTGFEIISCKGTSGFLLEKFNFVAKIPTPRLFQILMNNFAPSQCPGIIMLLNKPKKEASKKANFHP